MAVALEFSLVSLTPFLFPPAKAFSVLLAFLDDGSGEDAVADESANADTDAASALQNSLKTICKGVQSRSNGSWRRVCECV